MYIVSHLERTDSFFPDFILKTWKVVLTLRRLIGELAHLVERLVRNQKVVGSSPIFSTIYSEFQTLIRNRD